MTTYPKYWKAENGNEYMAKFGRTILNTEKSMHEADIYKKSRSGAWVYQCSEIYHGQGGGGVIVA